MAETADEFAERLLEVGQEREQVERESLQSHEGSAYHPTPDNNERRISQISDTKEFLPLPPNRRPEIRTNGRERANVPVFPMSMWRRRPQPWNPYTRHIKFDASCFNDRELEIPDSYSRVFSDLFFVRPQEKGRGRGEDVPFCSTTSIDEATTVWVEGSGTAVNGASFVCS